MRYRVLGCTGVKVSELCLGAMNFGHPRFGIPEPQSIEVINAFLDAGGNFIDTADAYGGGVSEQIVGRALAGKRHEVLIATKGFFPIVPEFGMPPQHVNAWRSSRRHLTEALHGSLRRLGMDTIDLYQVHCWDDVTPPEETLSTLNDFVRSGKVRYVGLSNYSAWQIAESRWLCRVHGWEPFVTAQMQYSLICRHIEDDVIPACRRYGMRLLPWSPLGQGALTGKYRKGQPGPAGARFSGQPMDERAAQWRARFLNEYSFKVVEAVERTAERLSSTPTTLSIAWLLAQEIVSSVIIGPKSVEQLADNLAACELAIPPDLIAELDTASAPPERYPEAFIRNRPGGD
jgi:aryl-alcohol dehydrogenase-like predicted oxidoreductase